MALLKKKGAKPIVAVDDGHGMATPGKRTPNFPAGSGLKSETGNFMHENEFNRAVAKYLKEELIRNGFTVIEVAPTDADTSLPQRAKIANNAKADLYVSIHANAATGKWGTANGVEVLSSPKNKDLANVFLKHLIMGTKQRNRGWKDGAWLAVVKETIMPAILIEAGFMDNLTEAKLLLQDAFRKECAVELAKATCEVFGITYKGNAPAKPSTNTSTSTKYPYDATKGIGTLEVLVDALNVRGGASFSSPVITTLGKHEVYYVYETKNGLHRVSDKGWVSAGTIYTRFTAHPKVVAPAAPARKVHTVVKGDTLWKIATNNKLTVDKLMALNPKLTTAINPGDKIYLS